MDRLYCAIVVPRDAIDCNQLMSITQNLPRTHKAYAPKVRVGEPVVIHFILGDEVNYSPKIDGSLSYLGDRYPTLNVNEVSQHLGKH